MIAQERESLGMRLRKIYPQTIVNLIKVCDCNNIIMYVYGTETQYMLCGWSPLLDP